MASSRITKWKFHVRKGYWAFQRQSGILGALESLGEGIAARAGDGVEVESELRSGGRGTPRVAVVTATAEAKKNEATDRSLTRAL